MSREIVSQISYLVASVLFIFGLRGLTKPDKARRGMLLAAVGMLVAIVGTLVKTEVVSYGWILVGLVLGSLIGYPLGMWVPMTAMPQRIAFSHMFGALAATLVGVSEYFTDLSLGEGIGVPKMAALAFEVLFGALTVTGSFVAFGKLAEFLPGPTDHISQPKRNQPRPRHSRSGIVRICRFEPGGELGVLPDAGTRHAHRTLPCPPHRRRGHAGGHLA